MADDQHNNEKRSSEESLLDALPPELDLKLPQPPFWLIAAFLLVVVATWVPLVLIGKARVTTSTKPRIHPIQDMDNQPRFKAQAAAKIFVDGRAMRPPVPGTIARGNLQEDDHYYRGYTQSKGDDTEKQFVAGMPDELTIDEAFVRRGQQRFNIYCAVCHGVDGYGNGPVNQRAQLLMARDSDGTSWVQPSSLHTDTVRDQPDGQLFNTITHGIRNMRGYGAQIEVEDRWAIVAYVRALQLSQKATLDDVTPQLRDNVK